MEKILRLYNTGVVGILLNVHVVVFSLREDALHVLLASAVAGRWGLPGEDVEAGESLEATANRALSGCLGHREAYLEQLYTYGDAAHNSRDHLVSVVYFALIPADSRRAAAN